MTDSSRQYFFDQDKLAQFLQERCIIEKNNKIPTTEFLAAYNAWNEEGKSTTSKDLTRLMRFKGFEKKVLRIDGNNTNVFTGVTTATNT